MDRGSSFLVFPEQGTSVAVAPAVQHVQREAGEEVRCGSIRWRSSERRRAFPRGCADLGGARAVVVEEGARGVGVEEDADGERALRRGERVVPVASRVRAGGRRPGQRRRVVVFSRVVGHHPRQPLGHRAHAVGDERHPHRSGDFAVGAGDASARSLLNPRSGEDVDDGARSTRTQETAVRRGQQSLYRRFKRGNPTKRKWPKSHLRACLSLRPPGRAMRPRPRRARRRPTTRAKVRRGSLSRGMVSLLGAPQWAQASLAVASKREKSVRAKSG